MLMLLIEKLTPKLYNSLNGNIMRNDKTSHRFLYLHNRGLVLMVHLHHINNGGFVYDYIIAFVSGLFIADYYRIMYIVVENSSSLLSVVTSFE
jgi:hypothetical protein